MKTTHLNHLCKFYTPTQKTARTRVRIYSLKTQVQNRGWDTLFLVDPTRRKIKGTLCFANTEVLTKLDIQVAVVFLKQRHG
jgi:hypothetical protein